MRRTLDGGLTAGAPVRASTASAASSAATLRSASPTALNTRSWPLNSVLSNEKFARTFGFQLEDWQTALAEVMGELREQAQG